MIAWSLACIYNSIILLGRGYVPSFSCFYFLLHLINCSQQILFATSRGGYGARIQGVCPHLTLNRNSKNKYIPRPLSMPAQPMRPRLNRLCHAAFVAMPAQPMRPRFNRLCHAAFVVMPAQPMRPRLNRLCHAVFVAMPAQPMRSFAPCGFCVRVLPTNCLSTSPRCACTNFRLTLSGGEKSLASLSASISSLSQ